ncbi:hypothetical protein CHUAL_001425 [Chamberlinius hualienensis]
MPTKPGEETYVIAKYDYKAQGNQELDIKKNEKLLLLDDSKHWWKVQNSRNLSGYVPSNYVKREKPSIFDSIKRKVKKKPEFKTMPLPNTGVMVGVGGVANCELDINVNSAPSSDIPPEPQVNSTAVVKYNYDAQQIDEISLVKGTKVLVMEKSNDGWWRGEYNGLMGWFPSNYVLEEDGEGTCGGPTADCSPPLPPGTCIEVVVALYSFVSQNEEELNFHKGERLEIIEKPANDPEWWRARNSQGEIGLVPKNYVKVVSEDAELNITGNTSLNTTLNGGLNSTETSLENTALRMADLSMNQSDAARDVALKLNLSNKSWYHGNITRNHCDKLLNELGTDGDYLIRDSETNVSFF